MLGMTRPGDMVTFKGIITKKYEKDGKKLVDMDIASTTKTSYVRGEANSSLNEDEVLANLAKAKIKVNIDYTVNGEMNFELKVEADGIDVNPKRVTGEEPLIRNWIRAGKDKLSAELLGKKKGEKFWFGIIRLRDSIVGTATCVIPE